MTSLTISRLSLSASALAFAAVFSTPALAQTPPITPGNPPGGPTAPPCPPGVTTPQPNCTAGEVSTESGQPVAPNNPNAIVVTGSRIQRPNLESPVPITSISQEELTNQGQVSVGDALNDLPALRSTFSQQNSGRFIGTAGQNFLDLRGLGTNRTLVLVNGRRFVTEAPGSFDVDVDNVPQDLIDRIDIVTGGESAVYGSDAVAGVVNFILKKDFEGFRIKGQGGESTHGDRPIDFISTTFGKNFADGRGNLAVNLEYTHAGELFFRDRKHFSDVCGFQPNPNDTDDEGNADSPSGEGDNVFVCGLRNPFVTLGGSIGLLDVNGQTLSFDPTGNLVITSPATQSFIAFNGTEVSNDTVGGATLRETGDLAVGRDRYMANLLGHFDVTDWFKPFVEGTFVHQIVHQEFQPSFFQGHLSNFFGPIVPSIKCSNGFLTAQNIAVLQSFGLCSNLATSTLPLNRFNVDMGGRQEIDTRNTYRIVTGFTGDFNGDWHYELSFNYGHHHANNAQHNDLQIADQFGNPAGFALAVDAVSVDANGNILLPGQPGFGQNVVCRSTLTDPTNGCVPIDLFGEGKPSAAALAFVNRTSHLYQAATQMDLLGFMSGDSSQWFNLQGGPVGFSVGAEYRRETAESHADPVSASGGTFFNAFPKFNPPDFKVFEFFGELNVPILKDLPFAHELTVSGAARESHYNTSAGHTFAWNANAIWSPVRDLRLRANYSKSVRVPTLGDLFTPPTVNFEFVADPCNQIGTNNITSNPNRAANCAALGVPTTVVAGSPCISAQHPVGSPFTNCIANTQTIEEISVGNPNLTAETGKSLTLGGVFTPRWVPGFSLSVDYFRINVTNLIATLTGQQILNACVDLPTIQNQFCALINPRDQFGLLQSPALTSNPRNFAKQISRGIDFDLAYRHRFANGMRINLRGIATRTLQRENFTDPSNPNFGDDILSELGDPKWSGTFITGVGMGKFDLRWTVQYIGSMTDFAFEDTHHFKDACSTVGTTTSCPPFDPDVAINHNTGAVFYHDVRLDYTINKYNFYVGVDNIFNKLPPLGLTGAGAGSGIYSNFGRFVYAGAVLDLR